jgi:hypothetical protein
MGTAQVQSGVFQSSRTLLCYLFRFNGLIKKMSREQFELICFPTLSLQL